MSGGSKSSRAPAPVQQQPVLAPVQMPHQAIVGHDAMIAQQLAQGGYNVPQGIMVPAPEYSWFDEIVRNNFDDDDAKKR